MIKSLLFLSVQTLFILQLSSQPWHYDLGTSTGSFSTSNTASTTFLPLAPSGISRVKVSNGQGGSFNLENQVIPFGDGVYLRISAPTGGSVNKLSLYDYTAGNCFTIRFKMRLGSSSGSSIGAPSGSWYFFAGDGASFSNNTDFTSTHVFAGLQFAFGPSGAITTSYRSGVSWVTSGISGTPFAQGIDYNVEIYGNNSSAEQTYSYNDTTRYIASYKWDLWVNGVLIGNDLSKGQLADNVNIDSWMFYGLTSTDNTANIFLDEFDYTNMVSPTMLPVKLSFFTVTSSGRNSILSWGTDWELNNAGFDIERTQQDIINGNSSSWIKIGFAEGYGTTFIPRSYTFEDKNLSYGKFKYRLMQIDYNGNYEYFVSENSIVIGKPNEFKLDQNYPNPSNPKSKIDYQIPFDGNVTLKVYDLTGKEITTLVNGFQKADYFSVEFDGTNFASGIYFYRISAAGENQIFTRTLKMVLIK